MLFDFIFQIDVLEHLEDDESFLKQFYDKLKSGGKIFIYVPARQELYSSFDKSIGHFRRYSKKELRTKAEKAGFKTERIRYYEIIGYFASAVHNLLIKKSEPSVSSMKFYDKVLVPTTNVIERVISPPFGKSLYLSAIK